MSLRCVMSGLLVFMLFGSLLVAAKPFVEETTTTDAPVSSEEEESDHEKRMNEKMECVIEDMDCELKTKAERLHRFARDYWSRPSEEHMLAGLSFQSCAKQLLDFTREGFASKLYLENYAIEFDKSLICDLHREVTVPMTCLFKKHCDDEMASAYYLAAYSYGQIALGDEFENKPLGCDHVHELRSTHAELNNATKPSELLHASFCDGIQLPKFRLPRRLRGRPSPDSADDFSEDKSEDEENEALKTAEESED
ncbi:hypothetical protein M3Y98_00674600 [Aphelenchoides besseyi]|nr:hypothetical protein M3Y98_00674600 [Aphelenchoides besseyi]KAI6209155.1 hypothetical protein M3Y96_00191200 [Aphelenchoides besseyi]